MLGFSNIPFWNCHMKWTLKMYGIPLRHFFSQIQLRDTVWCLCHSLLNTLYIWEHYNDLTNPLSLALSLNWTTWTMNGSGNDGYKVWLIPVIIILSLNVLHRKQHHTQHAAFLSNISPWWWLPIIVLHFILIQFWFY